MKWMEENESFLVFSLHLVLVMMQVTPLTEQCPAAFVCWKKAGFFQCWVFQKISLCVKSLFPLLLKIVY